MNYSDPHKMDSLRTGDDLLARMDELTREFVKSDGYAQGRDGWRPLLWAAKRDIERLVDALAQSLSLIEQVKPLLEVMHEAHGGDPRDLPR